MLFAESFADSDSLLTSFHSTPLHSTPLQPDPVLSILLVSEYQEEPVGAVTLTVQSSDVVTILPSIIPATPRIESE